MLEKAANMLSLCIKHIQIKARFSQQFKVFAVDNIFRVQKRAYMAL